MGLHIGQCFSASSRYYNQLVTCSHTGCWTSRQNSLFSMSGMGPSFYISGKFSSDATAGLGLPSESQNWKVMDLTFSMRCAQSPWIFMQASV